MYASRVITYIMALIGHVALEKKRFDLVCVLPILLSIIRTQLLQTVITCICNTQIVACCIAHAYLWLEVIERQRDFKQVLILNRPHGLVCFCHGPKSIVGASSNEAVFKQMNLSKRNS